MGHLGPLQWWCCLGLCTRRDEMAMLHSCLWEGKKSTQNQLKQHEKNQKTETIIFPQEEGKKSCVYIDSVLVVTRRDTVTQWWHNYQMICWAEDALQSSVGQISFWDVWLTAMGHNNYFLYVISSTVFSWLSLEHISGTKCLCMVYLGSIWS